MCALALGEWERFINPTISNSFAEINFVPCKIAQSRQCFYDRHIQFDLLYEKKFCGYLAFLKGHNDKSEPIYRRTSA